MNTEAMMRASEAFRRTTDAARALALSIHEWDERLYRMAKLSYIVYVGKLPGSTRTARLRKKRRDAVLRWWRETVDT